jgi:hypothetical protein
MSSTNFFSDLVLGRLSIILSRIHLTFWWLNRCSLWAQLLLSGNDGSRMKLSASPSFVRSQLYFIFLQTSVFIFASMLWRKAFNSNQISIMQHIIFSISWWMYFDDDVKISWWCDGWEWERCEWTEGGFLFFVKIVFCSYSSWWRILLLCREISCINNKYTSKRLIAN